MRKTLNPKDKNYQKTKYPNIEDWYLWEKVTLTINPLSASKIVAPKEAKPKEIKQRQSLEEASANFNAKINSLQRKYSVPSYSPTKQIKRLNTNIEPNLLKRIERSHLPIQGTLDLHSMNQDEAHRALINFVTSRFKRGARTLLIITGKGKSKTGFGVLRSMLPLWLNSNPLNEVVSAWQVSTRKHGGEGAFYVRLRGKNGGGVGVGSISDQR